ncbi:hypothetical protein LOD99_14694 [Oopsacas minuta]|uniref:Uncharacterized protein n=1 Tax=Oopsacas minuta TaxID=111878 RepID=A0AAV7KDR5_9METZ|nr:hypothetical protein LOD99_14694 [Oopsacas minuta]
MAVADPPVPEIAEVSFENSCQQVFSRLLSSSDKNKSVADLKRFELHNSLSNVVYKEVNNILDFDIVVKDLGLTDVEERVLSKCKSSNKIEHISQSDINVNDPNSEFKLFAFYWETSITQGGKANLALLRVNILMSTIDVTKYYCIPLLNPPLTSVQLNKALTLKVLNTIIPSTCEKEESFTYFGINWNRCESVSVMAALIQPSNFKQDAISFFAGLIDNNEVDEIAKYHKHNILDYVKTNICFEHCFNLEETKEEWKVRIVEFEGQYKVKLAGLKRCYPMDKFSTVIQNDYGNLIDGSKDFFVYAFYWTRNKRTNEANYVISGIRVEFAKVTETKGWFTDGKKLNQKITKHFIHTLARETMVKLGRAI